MAPGAKRQPRKCSFSWLPAQKGNLESGSGSGGQHFAFPGGSAHKKILISGGSAQKSKILGAASASRRKEELVNHLPLVSRRRSGPTTTNFWSLPSAAREWPCVFSRSFGAGCLHDEIMFALSSRRRESTQRQQNMDGCCMLIIFMWRIFTPPYPLLFLLHLSQVSTSAPYPVFQISSVGDWDHRYRSGTTTDFCFAIKLIWARARTSLTGKLSFIRSIRMMKALSKHKKRTTAE